MNSNALRRIALFLTAGPALLLLPGCIGMAVRGIHETVAPAQPILRDSVAYFSGGVHATAVLMPVRKGRSHPAAFLFGGNEDDNLPLPGYEAPSPEARMVLWTVLTNSSGVTAEITVRSETCALGAAKGKVVDLAPGQRVMLDPLWSAQDQNLDNLEVALTLELHGVVEENKLTLAQARKP